MRSRKYSASLTVEASLVMPLFLFMVYLFWILFTVLILQVRVQSAADQVTGQLAQQSYLAAAWQHGTEDEKDKSEMEGMSGGLSVGSILKDAAWKSYAAAELKKQVGEDLLAHNYIVHGVRGLSVVRSRWDLYGDLDLRIDYTIALPALLGFRFRIPLTQHSLRRSWTGCQSNTSGGTDNDASQALVYVTESGSVFHRDINCYHLNLSVREVSVHLVGGERNQGGGKYYPCEHCAVAVEAVGRVFIAKTGDRYHTIRDCSGLKRTIRSVPESSVAGMRPCKNCGLSIGE